MKDHYENIICPNCDSVERVQIEYTGSWIYQHICVNCGYEINEKEWDTTTLNTQDAST